MKRYGSPTEQAFLFPSHAVAERCVHFFVDQVPALNTGNTLRTVDLYPNVGPANGVQNVDSAEMESIVSAVIFPRSHSKVAKTFWQHSGDGISSRRAEYCHKAFNDGRLAVQRATHEYANGNQITPPVKGPRRYQKRESTDLSSHTHSQSSDRLEGKDHAQFVEERFGRNLDVSLAVNAKLAIRRRIAGALTANVDLHEALEMSKPSTRTEHAEGFSEQDVYLYPCGMSSIFNTHRSMIACRGASKSISFG